MITNNHEKITNYHKFPGDFVVGWVCRPEVR